MKNRPYKARTNPWQDMETADENRSCIYLLLIVLLLVLVSCL